MGPCQALVRARGRWRAGLVHRSVVRAWDHRQRKNPAKVQLHVNPSGHGAVSSICAGEKALADSAGVHQWRTDLHLRTVT